MKFTIVVNFWEKMGGKYSCEGVFFGFDWCLKDGYDIIFIYIAFLEKFFDVFFDSVPFKDERSEVEEFREVKSVVLDSSLRSEWQARCREIPSHYVTAPSKRGEEIHLRFFAKIRMTGEM